MTGFARRWRPLGSRRATPARTRHVDTSNGTWLSCREEKASLGTTAVDSTMGAAACQQQLDQSCDHGSHET